MLHDDFISHRVLCNVHFPSSVSAWTLTFARWPTFRSTSWGGSRAPRSSGATRGGTVRSSTREGVPRGHSRAVPRLVSAGDGCRRACRARSAESRPEWLSVDLAVLTAGGASRSRSTRRCPRPGRATSSPTPRRTPAVVSTRHQLEKLQEVRHELPALEAVVVMDAGGRRGTAPSVLSLADVDGTRARAADGGVGRRAAVPRQRPRACGPSSSRRSSTPPARPASPKGVMLTHANLVSNLAAAARGRSTSRDDVGAVVPAAQPRVRADGGVRLPLAAACTIVFAESFDTIGRDIGLVRPTVMTGVPRVYEKLHARGSSRRARTRRRMPRRRSSAGRSPPGPRRARRGTAGSSSGGRCIALQARLAERLGLHARFARRSAAGSATWSSRQRAARRRGRRVLLRALACRSRGLRPDRDRADPHRQSAGRAACRHRRPQPSGRRAAHRRRRRDPRARTERDAGLLQQAGGDRGGPQGRLVPHRRHRHASTRRATSRSPTARRTCSSRRAARRSRRSRSKPSSSAARSSPKPWSLGDRRNYAAALIVPDFPALERRLKSLGRPPGDARRAGRPRRRRVALRGDRRRAEPRALAVRADQADRAAAARSSPSESGELTPTLKVKRRVVEQKYTREIEALYSGRQG